ncbi:MAG TPA: efflux transporter outer membrane subunit [Thermodesulfobacteriota bacterium]|nr:efflux transporter outer membrane subunit [Thermodesulfobacteriota bacterium]
MRFISAILLTTILLASAGCTVGPDYKTPQTDLPESFQDSGAKDFSTDSIEIEWWSGFSDPVLDKLIQDALAGSYDIQIATARILEARALRTETEFQLAPIVPFNASYTKQQVGESTVFPGVKREADLYEAGFDAVWELDFFGRIRRTIEADTAEVQSREAQRRDVIVSLLAEVARNYFELRGAQNQLDVARRNAANQQNTLDLTITLLEGGRGTELDTSRARAQLNNTLAIIPPLEARVRTTIYRLGVLTGRQPDAYLEELLVPKPFPKVPDVIRIGTPVGLLERRPDIRVAERNLAGFTASIGIATAELFPQITLLGSISLQADTFSGVFESGAGAFSIGPNIFWPAFDLGRVYQRVKQADARTQAAFAEYQLTVLQAIEDVDSSLVEHNQQIVRYKYLAEAAVDSEKAMKLARMRYDFGVASFLDVLDAERTLLQAQTQLAASETDLHTSLVAVYKSLGGGWEIYDENMAETSANVSAGGDQQK